MRVSTPAVARPHLACSRRCALSSPSRLNRREIERRVHPRTTADFGTLTSEVDAWRAREVEKLKGQGLTKEQEQVRVVARTRRVTAVAVAGPLASLGPVS